MKKEESMEDSLGKWSFIHGTGAGCASIAAWEGSHMYLHGGTAVIFFTGVTVGIMHVVHKHRVHLSKKAGEQ